jgi:hypothetical protein
MNDRPAAKAITTYQDNVTWHAAYHTSASAGGSNVWAQGRTREEALERLAAELGGRLAALWRQQDLGGGGGAGGS